MSSVVNWLKRNQRKLVVGSAVVGGLYVVGRIAERQIVKNHELETQKLFEKARKQNHFSATESTCTHTLAALFPTLRRVVEQQLDADSITTILREKPSPQDKIEFWNELKVIAISRCVVLVVGGVYLSVMLRAQLNILAGYLYGQELAGGPNIVNNNNLDIQKGKFSSELQEKFLNICTYFVSEGVSKLCESVSETVKRCTAKITLNEKLSLVDLEAVLNDVFENCKTLESDRNIFNNPGIFFLPTSENFLSDIHPSDQGVLKQMFAETMDVLDSEDSISMAHLVCKQGLGYTVDKIAEYYAAVGLSGSTEKPSPTNPLTKNALHDSGFVSPANVSLPLAKLIPILSAQVRAPPDEDDAWLTHLQENPPIKLLGANVYEAFSEPRPAPDKPQTSGWGEYLYNTALNWF
jgi:peroxin-3